MSNEWSHTGKTFREHQVTSLGITRSSKLLTGYDTPMRDAPLAPLNPPMLALNRIELSRFLLW